MMISDDILAWLGRVPDAPPPLPISVQALLVMAQTQLDRGDLKQAFTFFEIASRGGHPAALNMLGRVYERGWGCDRDPERARRFFCKASQGGDAWAMFNLADLYLNGDGGGVDQLSAYRIYAAAAERGVYKALNMLGVMSENGLAVETDVAAALRFYESGAKAGDGWASFNAARLHHEAGNLDAARAFLNMARGAKCDGVAPHIAELARQLREGPRAVQSSMQTA